MLYFLLSYLKQTIYRIKIRTGNDLETSKVPLSVLFCIIEKNALFQCKGNESF